MRFYWNIVAVILFALSLLAHFWLFWPGGVSPDSQAQYHQALSGIYSTGHPPIMAFLWRLLDGLLSGSRAMLILQTSLIWGSLFILWQEIKETSAFLGIFIFLYALTPMMLGISGMIWKDVLMTGFALLAYSLVISRKQTSFFGAVMVSASIWMVVALRHNGLFLVIPLIFVLSWDYLSSKTLFLKYPVKIGSSLFLSFLIIISLLASAHFFNLRYLDASETHLEQTIFLHDLAVIGNSANQSLVPQFFFSPTYSQVNLTSALESKICVDGLIYGSAAPFIVTKNLEQLSRLRSVWLSALWEHPTDYLKHRMTMWLALMGWDYGPCRIFSFYFNAQFGEQFSGAPFLQSVYTDIAIFITEKTPFFKGWFWLFICFVSLLTFLIKAGFDSLRKVSLPMGALFYGLGYIPASVCCDFRYVWPIGIMGVISLLLAVDHLKSKSEENLKTGYSNI